MFFRKRQPETKTSSAPEAKQCHPADEVAERVSNQKRVSTADTAHLIGPGCVRLEGKVPVWQPVDGAKLQLHPKYLCRVLCYGNVDFSTAVLRQFWRNGVQVAFLSPSGSALLGRLQPSGGSPNLPRLQHIAANDPAFCLRIAQELVEAKIAGTIGSVRYYQQQSKGAGHSPTIQSLAKLSTSTRRADSVDELRGLEGSAAAAWFSFLPTLLPDGWSFEKRSARPPKDPVNALLSLGYALAHHRCETLLAAADLDPRVGFLHDVRPGRSSLACDLVEPLRVPLVDRLVIGLLNRKAFGLDSFRQQDNSWRLEPDALKKFLAAFEDAFQQAKQSPTFKQQTLERIEQLCWRIRQHYQSQSAK